MSAKVEIVNVTRYEVRCEECDLIPERGARRQYAQERADQHNKYAHSDPPIPHSISHVHQNLMNYSVECICGYVGRSETSNVTRWACPLDRTKQ